MREEEIATSIEEQEDDNDNIYFSVSPKLFLW